MNGAASKTVIDINATLEWGIQPILDAIPASCGVLKLKTAKSVGYNHVYYFFKDLFSSTLVGMVIDPFFECKLAFVAFDSVDRAERAETSLSSRKILGGEVEMSVVTKARYEEAQQAIRTWNWQERYYPATLPPVCSGFEELGAYTTQVCTLGRTLGGSDADPVATRQLEISVPGLKESIMLNYQIIGSRGQVVVFIPPGQSGMMDIRHSARALCRTRTGLRGVLWDRRNTGSSDVSFDHELTAKPGQPKDEGSVGGEKSTLSELRIQVEDLHQLLQRLAFVPGGTADAAMGSSKSGSTKIKKISGLDKQDVEKVVLYGEMEGASLAALYSAVYPDDVKGLILVNPCSSCPEGMGMAAEGYYQKYVDIATHGGMEAIAKTTRYSALIRANNTNKDKILNTDVAHFCSCMRAWSSAIYQGGGKKMGEVQVRKPFPILGVSTAELKQVEVPARVIFSLEGEEFDTVHTKSAAQNLANALPYGHLVTTTDHSSWFTTIMDFTADFLTIELKPLRSVKDPLLQKLCWPGLSAAPDHQDTAIIT